MRLPFRAAVALATLALAAATPAHADPPNDATYLGGCVLAAVNEEHQVVTAPNRYEGVLAGAITAASPTLGHNLVEVTGFRCEVRVNGTVVEQTQPGTLTVGFAAVADAVSFTAFDSDVVQVCTFVSTLDAHLQTRTFSGCNSVIRSTVPPQEVIDPIYDACILATTNPFLCQVIENTQGRVIVGFSG